MSVHVQRQDFDIGQEMKALEARNIDAGAVVTFIGRVRGNVNGQPLRQMYLEYYPGMTENELIRLENEATTRWPLQISLIIHRHGHLEPGDNIVLVMTASGHRQAAFEAAQYMMDALKTRAPFWKKEIYANGASNWVDAREHDDKVMQRWLKT